MHWADVKKVGNEMRVILSLMATAMVAVPATAATFMNGSFEQPGGAPIRRFLTDGDTFVTGWTNNGGFQIYESSGQDSIAAGEGAYYVSFGHNGAIGGTLSQTFDTVINQAYTVNYLVRQQQGNDSAQSLTAEIVGGPSVLNGALSATDWLAGITLSFVATNASTTLRFRDSSTSGSFANVALDAVSVIGAGPAVPEPASWAMMIAGFGMTGAAMRRRSRKLVFAV